MATGRGTGEWGWGLVGAEAGMADGDGLVAGGAGVAICASRGKLSSLTRDLRLALKLANRFQP